MVFPVVGRDTAHEQLPSVANDCRAGRLDRVTITIYGRQGCGQCEQTKKQLARKGLDYNEIDIDADEAARDLVEDSATRLRPPTVLPMVVVKHDGSTKTEVWHGFRYDNIKALTTKNS